MRAPRTYILITILLAACAGAADPARDPLVAEIGRWSAFLEKRPADDKLRQQAEPARAQEALTQGKRLLAVQRLADARDDLAVASWMSARTAEQRTEAGFEKEWERMGGTLKTRPTTEDLHPAALRALAEASLPQVRTYYDASLEYGRNTMPEQGLYYLAAAQAKKEEVELLRSLSTPTSQGSPPLRSLQPELDALEAEMLAVYRPPLSIDRHPEFITASATLKEARELDEAGLRYGALLRYLQAALQSAPLRGASPPQGDLAALEKRLSRKDVDHSIGQLFVEAGKTEVLPLYFAALEPARPQPLAPAPRVTVTLVRWPYT
jgi:hypothetical protein